MYKFDLYTTNTEKIMEREFSSFEDMEKSFDIEIELLLNCGFKKFMYCKSSDEPNYKTVIGMIWR